jgi:hypothetical protein
LELTARVRLAGRPESHLLFPVCAVPQGLITENRRLEFMIEADGKPLDPSCDLLLNDVPAPRLARRGEAAFLFETEFYAGDVRIAVIRDGAVLFSTEIEVDPDAAKLTREEYAAMVAETARATLALYRLSAVTMPAAASAGAVRSDIVTLELIRTNLEKFEQAVSRIADSPLRTLASTATEVDALRARRIDDRAILAALRSPRSRPAVAAEKAAAPGLVRALGGRWAPRLLQTRREETLALYENRAIAGFLHWLGTVLAGIAKRLSDSATVELPSGTAQLWAERIARWRAKIAGLQRRSFFAGLIPDHSLRATSVFRLHPDYAAAFAAMMRMRAGLGPAATALPDVPVDRTYRLYELWCYVGLLAAAAAVFPEARPHVADILRGCRTPGALGTVLAHGSAGAIRLEEDLVLTYQRRVTPEPGSDGARTPLVEAIPDVVLCRTDPRGRCTGMVVLDPKYRVGKSLNEGIQDVHAYRDAIIGADGARLVRAAIVMAPRPRGLPTVSGALPLTMPGIAEARPGHELAVFEKLLAGAIDAVPKAAYPA